MYPLFVANVNCLHLLLAYYLVHVASVRTVLVNLVHVHTIGYVYSDNNFNPYMLVERL